MPTAVLELTIGSTEPFEVPIIAADGQPADLSGADRASVTVLESIGATPAILQRDTVTGPTLSIDVAGSKLVATLSGAESDALPAGTYVGEAAVRFGDDDSWKFTERFYVRFRPAVAAKV